jgi:Flp pilus assembly pilin Flp
VKKSSTLAQGTTEYALILALVTLVVLVVVALFGKQIAAAYQKAMGGFNTTPAAAGAPGAPAATSVATVTPIPRSVQAIAEDFMARTQAYYQANGQWPPTSGDAYFTALGLNPADYAGPVSGVIWQPNGKYIDMTPSPTTQVYVTDTKGKQLQLYAGWDIWCHADNGNCYYHDLGLGQQVILRTVTVTGN